MAEYVQHGGSIVKIIKSVRALKKSEYVSIKTITAGYKDQSKESVSEDDIEDIKGHAENLVDSKKSKYYLTVAGKADFGKDTLKGNFELFYDLVNIRIESATEELDAKLKGFLESSFVSTSLLDLLESVDDLSDII